MDTALRASSSPSARWLVPVVVMGGWLVFIASRQVALFPPGPTRPSEVLPAPVTVGVVAIGAAIRVLRPSLISHIGFLAVLTCGLGLLAAQLGQPLANATADYCGDQCRTAIIGRFVTFFGWPIAAAVVLGLMASAESRRPDTTAAERAAWTRSWAVVTLVLGLAASVVWWRTILPNG